MEQQQGADYQQLPLVEVAALEAARHDPARTGATQSAGSEEQQARAARSMKRAVATDLMERICTPANLNRAYQRVRANQGAPGVDGMTVRDLRDWLATHKGALVAALRDGTYQPQPVKGVTIPKASGGTRQLGIPTVVDRLVQQAILQVLSPLLDPTFSASSFGFRPGRSTHDALAHARQAVAEGYTVVVDLDLEAFFDRVNHDMVMARLARHVGNRGLLGIVRRFLEAGLLLGGVVVTRVEGTPQGGPLSPLLANLMLHDLDRELERRGHRFARYADDCNIYVRTQAAGERVLASVTRYLETRLKLRVNRAKSAVAPVEDRKFLGYRLLRGGRLTISPAALERVKTRIRAITRRNRGVALGQVVQELNGYLTGWVTYFRHAAAKTVLARLDQWINEKVRCYRLKQCKRSYGIARFLQAQGVPANRAWATATSGKGWWRKARLPGSREAMPIAWLRAIGLVSLEQRYLALNQ
jgi:RNA-directed DNA polymerase